MWGRVSTRPYRCCQHLPLLSVVFRLHWAPALVVALHRMAVLLLFVGASTCFSALVPVTAFDLVTFVVGLHTLHGV